MALLSKFNHLVFLFPRVFMRFLGFSRVFYPQLFIRMRSIRREGEPW